MTIHALHTTGFVGDQITVVLKKKWVWKKAKWFIDSTQKIIFKLGVAYNLEVFKNVQMF